MVPTNDSSLPATTITIHLYQSYCTGDSNYGELFGWEIRDYEVSVDPESDFLAPIANIVSLCGSTYMYLACWARTLFCLNDSISDVSDYICLTF